MHTVRGDFEYITDDVLTFSEVLGPTFEYFQGRLVKEMGTHERYVLSLLGFPSVTVVVYSAALAPGDKNSPTAVHCIWSPRWLSLSSISWKSQFCEDLCKLSTPKKL